MANPLLDYLPLGRWAKAVYCCTDMAIIWDGHLYLAEGQGALQHRMPQTDQQHVWASSTEANLFCLAPPTMAR